MHAISEPQLSVIIPTHSRPTKLRQLLTDLSATRPGDQYFEIIVAVDGPDDGPVAQARVVPATIPSVCLTQPHGGPAAARNLALQHAQAPWVLFLNDDARVTPYTIGGHLARIRRDPTARCAYLGRFDFAPAVIDSAWRRLLAESSLMFCYDRMRPDGRFSYQHFWTCNISVRTELVREVGAFRAELNDGFGDLAMSFHEDIELGWRLQRQFGLEVCYAAEIPAMHDHGLTPRDYFWREYRRGRAARAARTVNPAFYDEVWPWIKDADEQWESLRDTLGKPLAEARDYAERLRQRPAGDVSRSEIAAAALAVSPLRRLIFLSGFVGRDFEEFWPDGEAG